MHHKFDVKFVAKNSSTLWDFGFKQSSFQFGLEDVGPQFDVVFVAKNSSVLWDFGFFNLDKKMLVPNSVFVANNSSALWDFGIFNLD